MLHALDAAALRHWCQAGLDALVAHQREIDDLNVFPIADGDTGTNLVLTLQAAADACGAGTPGSVEPAGDGDAAVVLRTAARGAVLGARGNSGVIVGQLLRGLAEALPAAAPADGRALAGALSRAADAAYAAVPRPVEGTILTVARAAADAARRADSDELAAVAAAAASGAAEALRRTPSQLPALAGVVDAGGRGLVVLLDALVGIVTGGPTEPPARPPPPAPGEPPAGASAPVPPEPGPPEPGPPEPGPPEPGGASGAARHWPAEAAAAASAAPVRYAYEVQYLLAADAAAVGRLRAQLSAIGGSVAVADGGDGQWNVHVHVDDIGAAVEAGVIAGRPRQIRVTRFADALLGAGPAGALAGGAATVAAPAVARFGTAVVAVAPGEGVADLLAAEGVVVVEVGAGRTPSVGEVFAAIDGTAAANVVVLPNAAVVTEIADAAAERARAAGIEVAVVPTRSPVQGLAAIAVHDETRRFGDDVIAMAEAAAATRWAAVTIAARDALTMAGTCRAGDVLGLADGEVVLIGSAVPEVACELVDRLLSAGGELVTVLLGVGAPADLGLLVDRQVRGTHPGVEVTVYDGRQPDSPVLFGVE